MAQQDFCDFNNFFKNDYSRKRKKNDPFPKRVGILNTFALVLTIFSVLIRYLLTEYQFRRRPRPGTEHDQFKVSNRLTKTTNHTAGISLTTPLHSTEARRSSAAREVIFSDPHSHKKDGVWGHETDTGIQNDVNQ